MRRRQVAIEMPLLAFCEPGNAMAMGKEHVRVVGPEGHKYGGGIPGAALCGRDLRKGWDLQRQVTADAIRTLGTARPGDGHVWLCADCGTAAQRLLGGAP